MLLPKMPSFIKAFILLLLVFSLTNCGGFQKMDTRNTPVNAQERAKKNVEEGKGVSIKGMLGRKGGTNYEFSTSNPMWRASLEILDFLPMTTVDYSGGMIISDWYTGDSIKNESIKVTIRFLSNEVRSDSLKIIVHKKVCETNSNCKVSLLKNSKISEELRTSIIRQAALLEKELKN
jgi:hypothetical protein